MTSINRFIQNRWTTDGSNGTMNSSAFRRSGAVALVLTLAELAMYCTNPNTAPPNARRSNRCGNVQPTPLDVDTPCGQSCCGTALGWTAGLVFNVVNTCRSALWSFIRLPQPKCCKGWAVEGRDRRGARGGWRGGVLGAIGACFERLGGEIRRLSCRCGPVLLQSERRVLSNLC
jgi:hypothetical protein